jgi:phosphate transport system protein
MASSTERMLRDALDSFLKEDPKLARAVLKRDDEIDAGNVQVYLHVRDRMESDRSRVGVGIHILMVSHNLERIADLASNIAEDVIYMKQGKEVRHHADMNVPQGE